MRKEGRKKSAEEKTAGKYNRRNDRHERKVIADAKEQDMRIRIGPEFRLLPCIAVIQATSPLY
ncbi:MAG: hypothetical protein KH900_10635 [[Clostridium] symbiosum]|nr:hypothetical protein [[Clostridium] symbiosum]